MGDQNTGKSVQLRSMFLDWRLGNDGQIPETKKLKISYPLSNERRLYLRLTSPHEAGENIKQFLEKCDGQMQAGGTKWRRWNFAGALQISKTDVMPEGKDVVRDFVKCFAPERVRAVVLSPVQSGEELESKKLQRLMEDLRLLSNCEVMVADATSRDANGLMYADFFDFS